MKVTREWLEEMVAEYKGTPTLLQEHLEVETKIPESRLIEMLQLWEWGELNDKTLVDRLVHEVKVWGNAALTPFLAAVSSPRYTPSMARAKSCKFGRDRRYKRIVKCRKAPARKRKPAWNAKRGRAWSATRYQDSGMGPAATTAMEGVRARRRRARR